MEEKKEATKKAKTVKKQTEKPAAEQKPTEKKASPAQLKPEEKVLIMACKHPVVATAAIDAAKAKGVEVVLLEDIVIENYIRNKDAQEKQMSAMEKFLTSEKNRQEARGNAIKLYNVLTYGRDTNLEHFSERVFTETQVVHATTLTHRTAQNLFEVLRAFGYIEFVAPRQFKFQFSTSEKIETMMNGVSSVVNMLFGDIVRLRAEITNSEFDKEKKNAYTERLNKIISSVK